MKRSFAVIALGVSALFGSGRTWDDEWRITPADDSGMVRFSIDRVKPGSQWSMSSDRSVADFRGLSMRTVDSSGKAKFEYVRDAGRLVCEGYFKNGVGIGAFEFIPDLEYARKLQKLGYDAPDDNQMFSMLMSDVSLDFARGVKEANVPATVKQLIDMRLHGVSLPYLHKLKTSGLRGLTAENIVRLRIHGVD
jgi:hypothetical protein